jgi:hypothetical protein
MAQTVRPNSAGGGMSARDRLAADVFAAVEAHIRLRRIRIQAETAEQLVATVSPRIRDLCALVEELEG